MISTTASFLMWPNLSNPQVFVAKLYRRLRATTIYRAQLDSLQPSTILMCLVRGNTTIQLTPIHWTNGVRDSSRTAVELSVVKSRRILCVWLGEWKHRSSNMVPCVRTVNWESEQMGSDWGSYETKATDDKLYLKMADFIGTGLDCFVLLYHHVISSLSCSQNTSITGARIDYLSSERALFPGSVGEL